MSLDWTFSNYSEIYGPEFERTDLNVEFNFSIKDVYFSIESDDFEITYINEGSRFEHVQIVAQCGDTEKSTFHLSLGSEMITIWHELHMTEYKFSIFFDYDTYENLKKSMHDLDKEYKIEIEKIKNMI